MAEQRQALARIDAEDVKLAYRRWAPIYDRIFGRLLDAAIRQAASRANELSGRLLDVGVGTGLSLSLYKRSLAITGIDISHDMLERARERVASEGLDHVEALVEMDAADLRFPDTSFDIVAATLVMTVVPDPSQALPEMARVTRPGGRILICNHFSAEQGLRGALERGLAPLAAQLGWRPDFPVSTLLTHEDLELVSQRPAGPFGFFTLLEFMRKA